MMTDLSKILLFRMTHVQNIPHILAHGITHSKSVNANPEFVSIGDGSLIANRNAFPVPNGKTIGDYIPFYFGVRMPMLYVIQKGFNSVKVTNAEDIVYCVSDVQQIVHHHLNFVFTNGHAVDSFSEFYYPDDVINIQNIIDQKAIDKRYWKDDNDLDLKRRKEAEFLVEGDIPLTAIRGYIVYNDRAREKLISFGAVTRDIEINQEFYF